MTTDAPVDSSVTAKALPVPQATIQDTLLQSVSWICDHYGVGKSPETLTAGLPKGGLLAPSLALEALSAANSSAGLVERRVQALPKQRVPMVLLRKEQGGCIELTAGGKSLPIIPGMVASVEIRTGEKTILDYLLKPVFKAREAFRER